MPEGETFNITPKAMVAGQIIPSWSRQTYEVARDILIDSGFLRKVSDLRIDENGHRIGSQYTLGEHLLGTKDFRQTGEII